MEGGSRAETVRLGQVLAFMVTMDCLEWKRLIPLHLGNDLRISGDIMCSELTSKRIPPLKYCTGCHDSSACYASRPCRIPACATQMPCSTASAQEHAKHPVFPLPICRLRMPDARDKFTWLCAGSLVPQGRQADSARVRRTCCR
jgi:hypothetical protein